MSDLNDIYKELKQEAEAKRSMETFTALPLNALPDTANEPFITTDSEPYMYNGMVMTGFCEGQLG